MFAFVPQRPQAALAFFACLLLVGGFIAAQRALRLAFARRAS